MTAAAAPDEVWAALPRSLERAFDRSRARWFARIVRCEDRSTEGSFDGGPGETLAGFRVAGAEPPRRLALEGRHRYSRYRLVFEIAPADAGSRVRAVTHAEFPGVRGALYRALVIGSGGHRIVTRRILKSIARRAERASIRHRKEEA